VKLRLEPSTAQVELLRGYCGTARAAYNTLLYQVRANLGQRAAQKTYDIAADDMTPALSWHRFGLEKLLRENRAQWLPWHEQVPYLVLDRSAHNLAAALAKWKAGTARFPRYRTKHGPGAGLAPVTFKEKDAAWLTGGGRVLALPLSRAKRRELAGGVGRLGSVRVVKDGRGRRAAKLIRDGRGQVQEVTYSFSGGHWWAALRMRVLPAALTQATRRRTQTRAAPVGVDAGMGRHFATLGQPLPGVSDARGHIDAPMFLRRACKDLAVAARKLALTEAGSRRHAKALVRVQRLLPGRPPGGRPAEEGLPVRTVHRRQRLRAVRAGPDPAGRQARLHCRAGRSFLPIEQDVLGLWCSQNQAAPVRARVHLHHLRSESGP
jgi:putative transposase